MYLVHWRVRINLSSAQVSISPFNSEKIPLHEPPGGIQESPRPVLDSCFLLDSSILSRLTMRKATYTTIVHDTLATSGLTVQEFFIADVVDKLSNPYCTMLRDKLADLAGMSRSGLHGVLKRLESDGYIVVSRKGLCSTEKWKLLANTTDRDVQKVDIKRTESVHSNVQKVDDSIYIIDTNKDKQVAVQKEGQLPELFGKTSLTRLATIYSLLWLDTFATVYRPDYGAFGKALKPLLDEGLTEWQIASLLVTHFHWYGTDGEDEYAQKNLASHGYPIFWVKTNMNQYITHMENVLSVKLEDLEAVKVYVKENIKDSFKEATERGIIKTATTV